MAKRTKQHRDPRQVRLHVQLGLEAHRKLAVHCAMERKRPGALLTELIETHLKSYRIQALGQQQAAPEPDRDGATI